MYFHQPSLGADYAFSGDTGGLNMGTLRTSDLRLMLNLCITLLERFVALSK